MTEQSTQNTPPQEPNEAPRTPPAPQAQQQPPFRVPPQGPKRLVRSRDDRWIAGVCGGVGQYAGIDPNVVRLLAVIGGVFSAGTLVIAYLIAWVVMPEA
jgi:phage shock protein PspC (stress-responsive transcriptional regulator)